MNMNAIKSIYKFNKDAGLLDKTYSDERECAFPIEEALEGFTDEKLYTDLESYSSPKEASRAIVSRILGGEDLPKIADVDRLDKHLDIIVFSFGSIFKLGLTPQQAMKALGIVMEANMTKLNSKDSGQDAEGKQLKPKDFVGPEEKLQKLLDERTK